MLLCNDDKNEFMLFASYHKEPIAFPALQIGSEKIMPNQIARKIGLMMDTGSTTPLLSCNSAAWLQSYVISYFCKSLVYYIIQNVLVNKKIENWIFI